MTERNLLFALHDVSPFHQLRLERAEALFERWRIRKVAYLLIPNYHGHSPADQFPEFVEWCRKPRRFEVTWLLHGLYHRQMTAESATAAAVDHSAVNHSAVNEAEFAHLPAQEISDRLQRGMEIFRRTLGHEPAGFVAPRWQQNRHLELALHEYNLRWTEDYRQVRHVPSGRTWDCPAVTWATRTTARKWLSILGTPWLARRRGKLPLLRIAAHAFDFDHPETMVSIEKVLCTALADRQQASYDDLWHAISREECLTTRPIRCDSASSGPQPHLPGVAVASRDVR